MPTVTQHDPRCVGTPPHRPCYGIQALNRQGRWVQMPKRLGECNLSDWDGFCYTHKSMECRHEMAAWDREHGT